MPHRTPKRNAPRSTNVVSLVALVGGMMLLNGFAGLATGQTPDPQGWSNSKSIEIQRHTPPTNARPLQVLQQNQIHTAQSVQGFDSLGSPGTNQPVAIPSHVPANEITNDVRSQIGLAIYQEDVAANRIPIATSIGVTSHEDVVEQTANQMPNELSSLLNGQTDQLTAPGGIESTIKIALLFASLSLAPAIVLMTTSYVRVVVVLSLLRQAFGGQQLPPTQVLTALSLFLTFLIMTPVWSEVKKDAIDPYTQSNSEISWEDAWQRGVVPVKEFMVRQIETANNAESIEVFYRYLPENTPPPTDIRDVPLNVLLPAFMISELKVAFLLGFQIFLPFLVLDLVVSSVTVSMGMLMLPPNMVSFPLKLILFVMVDGWNLVVGMLLQSFAMG